MKNICISKKLSKMQVGKVRNYIPNVRTKNIKFYKKTQV